MHRLIRTVPSLRPILIGAACLFLGTSPRPAAAYDPDTHFQVTYTLCRAVGFTHDEAFTVAVYDQGMDDSNGTLANIGITPQVQEEILWHALADGRPETVLTRKNELFRQALGQPDTAKKLRYLGVFFHYQQDTWAHRVHPNSHPTDFVPYTQPLGHAAMGHQPDRPPFDPPCALRCLEEGIDYARSFLRTALGRTANPLFDGYRAANGAEDMSFASRGPFVHQLALDSSTRAREFTTGLIREQIAVYTFGPDANPNYGLRTTSNEAPYSGTQSRFRAHCSRFGIAFELPTTRPAPFTTLTTANLQSGNPPAYGAAPAPAKGSPITTIQNSNGQFIVASDGLSHNQWLYCKAGSPVQFEVVGPLNNCQLKVRGQDLYLSYNSTTGAVKLWNDPTDASYSLEKLANGKYAIRNLRYNQYIWLSGTSPYVTRAGDKNQSSGQWAFPGLP